MAAAAMLSRLPPPPGLELQQPLPLPLEVLLARPDPVQLQMMRFAKTELAAPRASKRSFDAAMVEEHNPDDLVLLQLHDSRSAAREMAQLSKHGELGPWLVDADTSLTAAARVFEAELKEYHIVTRGRHISRIREALPRPTHKKTKRMEVLEVKAAPPCGDEVVLLTIRDVNHVQAELGRLCGLQPEGPWFYELELSLEDAQRLFGVALQKHHVILPAGLETIFREALPQQWRSERRLKVVERKPWPQAA